MEEPHGREGEAAAPAVEPYRGGDPQESQLFVHGDGAAEIEVHVVDGVGARGGAGPIMAQRDAMQRTLLDVMTAR